MYLHIRINIYHVLIKRAQFGEKRGTETHTHVQENKKVHKEF